MKLGWLLKLYFLEDRFAIILLRTFKFGIIKTKNEELNGFSLVVGILFLEMQINLSLIKSQKIELKEYETGKA
tara:strand:- start:449 stop:667 length:219 start_codon:yes stop_codon:yes gene_type:complete